VVALAGDLEAPWSGLTPRVGEVEEGAALPEPAARVLHESFDLGFVLRLSHAGGVQHKTARLAVLHKSPRRAWVERVGAGHRSREVIDHQALGAALKKDPCLL